MTRVLVASVATGDSDLRDFLWPVSSGPIPVALAHHYLAGSVTEFLIIGRGVVAGYPVVGAQVATLTAVSPQSGGLAEAPIEGPLARMLLGVGLDAVVLVGVAEEPSGLVISHDAAGLRVDRETSRVSVDAGVWATDEALRAHEGDVIIATGALGMLGHQAASIVVNNGFPSAQGGLGAVMGGMNLKYLKMSSESPHRQATTLQARITASYDVAIEGNPLTASEKNYPGFALWPEPDLVGYAASQRFAGSIGPGLRGFHADAFMPFALDDGSGACPGCPQSCLKSFGTAQGMPIDGGRAHQLAISALASQGDETDVTTLVSFNALCHDLGVEHLAAEESLARVGYSRDESLGTSIVTALTEFPGGSGVEMRIKGMVIPPFDPRANQGLALGFALNPTGPRYDVLEHDIDFAFDRPWMQREGLVEQFGIPRDGLPLGTLDASRHRSLELLWLAWSGLDALGVCEYAAPPTRELTLAAIAEMVRDITGEEFAEDDIYEQGRLRLAMLRQCNVLLGVGGHGDELPEWFYTHPIGEGPLAGVLVNREEFESAADFLREALGWDDRGLAAGHPVRKRVDMLAREMDTAMEGLVR